VKGENNFLKEWNQINNITFKKEDMIVKIDYNGTLAVDVPDGPKKVIK
jgi:hypothetical protein